MKWLIYNFVHYHFPFNLNNLRIIHILTGVNLNDNVFRLIYLKQKTIISTYEDSLRIKK